jgi:hypothetical protein
MRRMADLLADLVISSLGRSIGRLNSLTKHLVFHRQTSNSTDISRRVWPFYEGVNAVLNRHFGASRDRRRIPGVNACLSLEREDNVR